MKLPWRGRPGAGAAGRPPGPRRSPSGPGAGKSEGLMPPGRLVPRVRSLQAKMFLVFALIATVPLLALSYLALTETRQALTQEVGAAHEDAAKAAAGFVDVYVGYGRVLVEGGARSPALRAALESGDEPALRQALQDLYASGMYRQRRVFDAVYLVDASGALLAVHPTGAPTGAQRAVPLAVDAAAPGQAVHLSVPPEGTPTLPLAIAVAGNATARAYLVGDVGLSSLGEVLQAFAPGPSRSVYLADSTGRLVFHPDREVLAQRPLWGDVEPVRRGLRQESGFVEHEDPAAGVASLASFARVPAVGWVVVASVPADEAYTALRGLTAVLVVLSGLLAGGILLASIVVANRIVRPVEELTEAARDLSDGKLHRRIRPSGRDEIGQLGAAFNDMAARIGESLEGLRRSEARYRNLVESANDLIFTVQPDGTVSFMGPLSKALLGRAPRELVGKPAAAFVHPADLTVFQEAVQVVLTRREPAFFVPHRVLARDGATRTVLTTFSPIFEGGDAPARVLGVARDVTQERRQELIRDKAFQMARLVSEEARLQPLASRGLALMLDVVGLRQGVAAIGTGDALREAAAAGAPLAPEAQDALRRLVAEATGAPEPRRATLPGGAFAFALPLLERGEALGAIALVGEAGPAQGAVDENLDVLAALASQLAVGLRRSLFEARLQGYAAELETRVAERTRELTEKSQEMESFLYSVSHDLKAPLISIQGYAQSLEEDYARALEGDGAFYLERIRRNATLMESLILDILELSRIGRIREHPEDVDLDALLAGIGARLGDRFQQAGGSLVLAPGLPRVHGERNRLDQLFTNLLDNALKYRHPDRPPRVEVEGEVVDGEARVRVRDNGRGIPARYHDRLFNVFQRLPAPGMDDPGGTGMGLAIVKRIVETHRGRVHVESTEGVGTTFHLAFPATGGEHAGPRGGGDGQG